MELAVMRREYRLAELDEASAAPDPFLQFERWLHQALTAQVPEPNAMTLATVDSTGAPQARIVLLKGVDRDGLVFYTHYHSAKGEQLAFDPRAALVFWWQELERQVRISGTVSQTSEAQSEDYFRSRPRASQVGALTSRQSRVVASRTQLQRRYEELERRYQHAAVPRPEHWGGYRVTPTVFEFWQGRASRLHDRLRYRRQTDGGWLLERLEP